VTKTASWYHFSWLHVTKAVIVDQNNCEVVLRGFNVGGVSQGTASGHQANPGMFAWFRRTFPRSNIFRLELNSYWYVVNAYVPYAKMGYQAWVDRLVSMIEAEGFYVELGKSTQFHGLPCGLNGEPPQPCYPQDWPRIQTPCVYEQASTGIYISDTLQMWQLIARRYANNPGVLYNSWSEFKSVCTAPEGHITDAVWRDHEGKLIDAIQRVNPRALVFVGGPHSSNSMYPILGGAACMYEGECRGTNPDEPDFTERNVVYDYHIYPRSPPAVQLRNTGRVYIGDIDFARAQQHGHALMIDEYGGLSTTQPYLDTLFGRWANKLHIGMAFFEAPNLFHNHGGKAGYILSPIGYMIQKEYAQP